MEVSVESTSTLGRKLKVRVPSTSVSEKMNEKIAKLAKEAHLKGFRKGKVPLSVIKQKFGESIRQEVIQELIRSAFDEGVDENKLHPAGIPTVEDITYPQGEDLKFVLSFEIYPEITLDDFSSFEIERSQVEINDNDVLNKIESLQDRLANWSLVERAVKNSDKITVDFERLFLLPEAKKEEQKQVDMIVGAEGVVPGLSEALIGKNKGEVIEIEVHYPDNWADKRAAGKKATLWVTIHHIFEKQILTQAELARKLGLENEDAEKLKSKVEEIMQHDLDQILKEEIQEKILEKLLEKNPVELPKALIDREKEAIRREISQQQRGQQPFLGTLDDEELNLQAKRRVELGLLLNEVIKKYGLKAEGKRVRDHIEKIASNFSKSSEVVEAYYKNNELLKGIERLVLLDQAIEAILKEAKVKEKKISFEEMMSSVETT